MNWGYSELFQNYDRGQIEHYLPGAWDMAAGAGIMVHFAETHDNNRLAAKSRRYARMRTGLCALFSHYGAFGFANGVEWYAAEKINVHNAHPLNWGAEKNQVAYLARLHAILKTHPTFHDRTELRMIQAGDGNHLVLHRHHHPTGKGVIVVVNLDDAKTGLAKWRDPEKNLSIDRFTDLISGRRIRVHRSGALRELTLEPGAVFCLSADAHDLDAFTQPPGTQFQYPPAVRHRRLRAKALEAWQWFHGTSDLEDVDPDRAAADLIKDPMAFCRALHHPDPAPRVTAWHWPRDMERTVMIPPGHFLLVQAPVGFQARIMDGHRCLAGERDFRGEEGTHFVLFCPLPTPVETRDLILHFTAYEKTGSRRIQAPLRLLQHGDNALFYPLWRSRQTGPAPGCMLAANGIGGMLRASVLWGKLNSRYDALMAANLNPECPEDRWVMLARCRGWVVFQGYYQELNGHCLDAFMLVDHGLGLWRFKIPMGQGEHTLLSVGVYMTRGVNAMGIVFHRHVAGGRDGRLPDDQSVQLILRPDVEDRNFHHTTKASQGPESDWPNRITAHENGFTFSPHPWRNLAVSVDRGRFHPQSEWLYMVHRSLEAERGLDPNSDLFSPGYFAAALGGGEAIHFTAAVSAPPNTVPRPPGNLMKAVTDPDYGDRISPRPLFHWLAAGLESFVVKRGELKSIIAGYPWFLDWGRDSLIAARGLTAVGCVDQARDVLKQFGRFEHDGTLPNMIHGTRAGNRDTSDAPLWFFIACGDVMEKEGNRHLLEERCGDRTMRQVLRSIGGAMCHGLANGVRMDPNSGLIFSPAHFTWMDTNYPAGSPRQGYPIEIQVLWHRALKMLAQIDDTDNTRWRHLARQVEDAVMTLFYLPEKGYLADCLHGNPGDSALDSVADDALRPNQLFALTLGTLTDRTVAENVLNACSELIVPGAIRSLADRQVHPPLPIWHQDRLLNDPNHPYAGTYTGDEDTHRKPAYHNGTAWTWPFPSFCEAWILTYGTGAKKTARAWLSSAIELLTSGCFGQIPEILDGNTPHHPRGCDAQAWGVSELVRVWCLAQDKPPDRKKGNLDGGRYEFQKTIP